jgi:hypothetical protein
MDDIVEWFDSEFNLLGFSLTPTMYDPYTFSQVKGVRYRNPNGGNYIITTIRIIPNIDIPIDEYKELIRNEIVFFLENEISNINKEKDFKPTKKINKLKL